MKRAALAVMIVGLSGGGWCGGAWAAAASNEFATLANKPVRMLVPSPPGGPSDFAGRLIAPGLGEAMGRNIVVDARQSVNGILSMETGARAAPDGATLVIGNAGTHVMNPGLYKRLPYDPAKDFVPVSHLISTGTAFVAHPKVPGTTFKEFVDYARKEPGRFNIGIAGAAGHVSTEVLKYAMGMKLTNVPYKGSSPTEIAVMSGEVDVALLSIPVAAPHAKSGRMKVYTITAGKRSPMLPEVPTVGELGIDFEGGNWHGLFLPAGASDRMVRALYREVAKIFEKPEIRDIVVNRGSEIVASTPEELSAKLKRDMPKYKAIMAKAGIEPQ